MSVLYFIVGAYFAGTVVGVFSVQKEKLKLGVLVMLILGFLTIWPILLIAGIRQSIKHKKEMMNREEDDGSAISM